MPAEVRVAASDGHAPPAGVGERSHKSDIVLGPLLRYVGTTTATVWVETTAPTERDVSRGLGGEPPATITILSGDVHTSYVAEVDLGAGAGPSRVNQVVCSPFRNPLKPLNRRVVRATGSRAAAAAFSALARACGVPAPSATWKIVSRPSYDNSIGELELDERTARITLYRSTPAAQGGASLTRIYSSDLSASPLPHEP